MSKMSSEFEIDDNMNYYAVVEFLSDDGTAGEVEVVPNLWLFSNDSRCYWPPVRSTTNISKMIAERAIPTEETWSNFGVKRVFGKYDNYAKAREIAKKAEVTSDVNSDSGPRTRRPTKPFLSPAHPPRKQPKVKNHRKRTQSSDSSSELDSLPPSPPRFSASKLPVPEKTPTTPLQNPVQSIPGGAAGGITNSFSKSTPKVLAHHSGTRNLGLQDEASVDMDEIHMHTVGFSSSAASSSFIERSRIQNSRTLGGVAEINQATDSIRSFISTSPATSNFSADKNCQHGQQIQRDLSGIKIRLTQIEGTLQLILGQLNTRGSPDVFGSFGLIFPISETSKLNLLEEKLTEENFVQDLRKKFKGVGGANAGEMTRRTLRLLLTDQVASGMNWLGGNGKMSFSKTTVSTVITDAVLEFFGAGAGAGNAKVVESAIKEWLKQAPNRLKKKTDAGA